MNPRRPGDLHRLVNEAMNSQLGATLMDIHTGDLFVNPDPFRVVRIARVGLDTVHLVVLHGKENHRRQYQTISKRRFVRSYVPDLD